MSIKKLFALGIAVLLLISTFTACGNNDTDDSASSVDSVNTSGSSSTTTYEKEETVDNNPSEPQSSKEETSSTESTPSNDKTSSTESTVSVEDPVTNKNPDGVEIYGSGTKADPYIDTPNANTHAVKTLSVPAGKSVFYNIYRVGGRILTINDATAYVVCGGKKYSAQGGKVSFKVIDALASDAVSFEIGNTGTTAKNFTITFADEQGSQSNPTVITKISEKNTLNLAEGNEKGHFYKYVATQNGTLKFYLLSGTEKGILTATNNRNSAQRSTESTDEGEVKTDDIGTYFELEVQKGDEIIIVAGSKPNKRGKYPATTIEWMAKY